VHIEPSDSDLAFDASGPLPTVLLRHDVPDGSQHIDWMIARDPAGTGNLITFRLDQRVDALRSGQTLEIERIADHRSRYLTYQGPISGSRGVVTQLRRGEVKRVGRSGGEPQGAEPQVAQPGGAEWELLVTWFGGETDRPAAGSDDFTQHLRLKHRFLQQWSVFFSTIDRAVSHNHPSK